MQQEGASTDPLLNADTNNTGGGSKKNSTDSINPGEGEQGGEVRASTFREMFSLLTRQPTSAFSREKLPFLNLFCFLFNCFFTFAPMVGWFGWKDNATISEENEVLITPAGWAFSIWGLIYLTEVLFVVWNLLPRFGKGRAITGYYFALGNFFQGLWSITFPNEKFALAAVFLLLIAISFGFASASLAPLKREGPGLPLLLEVLAVHLPIGLHAGWTLAAALVNVSVAAKAGGASIAAMFALAVYSQVIAAASGLIFLYEFSDGYYLAAIIWALGAIAYKEDVRINELGQPAADGLTLTTRIAWIALLVLLSLQVVVGLVRSGVSLVRRP